MVGLFFLFFLKMLNSKCVLIFEFVVIYLIFLNMRMLVWVSINNVSGWFVFLLEGKRFIGIFYLFYKLRERERES